MSASLVGSEMCIRDSSRWLRLSPIPSLRSRWVWRPLLAGVQHCRPHGACLLYTSDAADDM
eukprot:13610489-Alexandrium_andersonii.AAC.1